MSPVPGLGGHGSVTENPESFAGRAWRSFSQKATHAHTHTHKHTHKDTDTFTRETHANRTRARAPLMQSGMARDVHTRKHETGGTRAVRMRM